MTPKQILGFAVGPIGGAVIGVISLPIITWLFSQEDIGRLSMLQVVTSFGLLLFSLGLDQAYVREYHEIENKGMVLKSTFVPGFLLLASMSLVLVFFLEEMASLLFGLPNKDLGVLVLLCLYASFASRYLSLVLRMQEKGLAFSMSQVLPRIFFLLLISAYFFLSVEYSTFQLFAAHTFSIIVVFLVYAWNTKSTWLDAIKQQIDFSFIRFTLGYSFPLILGGLAYWGLTASDKVFLRWLSDFDQLGIYSVAVSFAAVASIFQSIFGTVWLPIVYKAVKNNENLDKVLEVHRYVLFVVVFVFCVVGLFSWIIDFILPETYSQVKYLVVPCLGLPLLYTLSETTVLGIGVTRRTMFALTASVIALLVNAGLAYLLVPHYGAAGAAVSTCLSFWLFFILRTEFSILVWKRIPRFNLYFYSGLCVVWGSIHGFMPTYFNFVLIVGWSAILALLIASHIDVLANIYVFFIDIIKRKIL